MEEALSREFSPAVQSLLKRVYLTLCCALLASAFGAYLHMLWNIGGLFTSFGFFGGMIWLSSTTPYEQPSKRLSLLLLSALLEGASVGPTIKLAFDVDISRFLMAASVGTAVPFACFAAAAMLVRRRDYLYLGGLLSSVVCILWWLQFSFPIFDGFASVFMFKFFELHVGVLLFVVYIVMNTHKIIEKAHGGDMDYVKHSLTFLTSFVAVLVRILISSIVNNFSVISDLLFSTKSNTRICYIRRVSDSGCANVSVKSGFFTRTSLTYYLLSPDLPSASEKN